MACNESHVFVAALLCLSDLAQPPQTDAAQAQSKRRSALIEN